MKKLTDKNKNIYEETKVSIYLSIFTPLYDIYLAS